MSTIRRLVIILSVGTIIFLALSILASKEVTGDQGEKSLQNGYADLFLTQDTVPPINSSVRGDFEAIRTNKCLYDLWNRESGWQEGRLNITSYACGIPQAHPCTKLYPDFENMKQEWRDDKLYLVEPDRTREIEWGLTYIKERYHNNSCEALRFQIENNWY